MAKIGIIGAGASGLVTGRFLREDGHDIVIFEKEAELGGVWAPARRYPGVTTQNTKGTFAFSDFPMPDHFDERPTGEQMLEYLKAYAARHGLVRTIRLATEVERAVAGEDGWRLHFRGPGDDGAQAEDFDFLVVCDGIYSDPNILAYPGQEAFERAGGRILHSTSFNDLAQVEGKRVLVVGFAKSACDISALVSDVAARTYLVFRHGKYHFPRYVWKQHIDHLFFTRFSGMFFPYWRRTGGEAFLHSWAGRPLVWAYWRTIRSTLRRATGLKRTDVFPEGPIESSFDCSSGLSPSDFFAKIRGERIQATRGCIERLGSGKVVLQSGDALDVDVVILATGFKQRIPFFDSDVQRRLRDASGELVLFRNILPVNLPALAFNGYNSSIFTQLTSEIAAVWLSEYIAGRLVPPRREEMLWQIDQLRRCLEANRPSGSPTECVVPFGFQYIEDLLRDLKLPVRRTGKFMNDWFKPIRTEDFAGLKEELVGRGQSATVGTPRDSRHTAE